MSDVSPELRPLDRIALDTAPIIYYIEEHERYSPLLEPVFQAIDRKTLRASISTLALTEVLVRPFSLERDDLAETYRRILTSTPEIDLETVDADTAIRAAERRARNDIRTPDALHLASAIEPDCDAFLTNDRELTEVEAIDVILVDQLTE